MKRLLILMLIALLLMASPAFADTIKIVTESGKTYDVAALRFVKHQGGTWTLVLANGRDLTLKSSEIKIIILPGAKPSELSPKEMQFLMQQGQTRSLEGIEKSTRVIALLMVTWSVLCAIAAIVAIAQ